MNYSFAIFRLYPNLQHLCACYVWITTFSKEIGLWCQMRFFWTWSVKGYPYWKGILWEDEWSPDSSIYTGTCLGTVGGLCNEIYLFSFSFLQGGSIQNTKSKRCLELVENNDNEFGYQLMLHKCSGQNWTITNMLPGSTLWWYHPDWRIRRSGRTALTNDDKHKHLDVSIWLWHHKINVKHFS